MLRQQDPEFVRSTFSSISRRYDLANHVLSGGLDFLWRRDVARLVAAASPRRVLDLATGSGDLAIEIKAHSPGSVVVGADFCLPMLAEASRKNVNQLVQADGLALPFSDRAFDTATVSFGLRNMASWAQALGELARVLRPGGRLFILDFSLPTNPFIRAVYRTYLHRVLPRLAGAVTGKPDAYSYLGESIESFPRGSRMTALIESAGFVCGPPRSLCLGIVSLYSAVRNSLSNCA